MTKLQINQEYRCDREECGKRFAVYVESILIAVEMGSDLRCPHCGFVQKHKIPGKILKVERA